MWFRRKKGKDADSKLSDKLVSLQSLLNEKKPASKDGTASSASATTTIQAGNTIENPPGPEDAGDNIKNAVASDEHLDWDFNVDLAAEEGSDRPGSSAFLQAVESEGQPGTEAPETGTVVPLRRDADENSPPDRVPAPDDDDDIPVLRNIVYLPTDVESGEEESDEKENQAQFVEQCLKDIRKRLKRHEMSPLTAYQERQFRIALTSLKVQKDTGRFE